ncbi:MAG: CHAD domain-containing protein [Clostridia bacterium]|nr:CHAD domain-containing protein [Clostridia bacterium]
MNESLKNKIPDTIVKHIRLLCYTLAMNSDNPEFETRHMELVESNCIKIAKRRGMDESIAVSIACMHDLGRVKNRVYGKGHAAESAVVAESILSDHGIDGKPRKIIIRAIGKHNRKGRIHDKYSELIKDADSISVFEGRDINGQRTFEYIRYKYADSVKCEVMVNPGAGAAGLLKSGIANTSQDLAGLKNSESPYGLIHEIRTGIRKARSVLWHMKNNPKVAKSGVMDRLDSGLNEIAEDYDRLRELQVFRKNIKGIDGCGELYTYLDKQRKNELKRILSKKLRSQIKMIEELQKIEKKIKNPAEGQNPGGAEYLKKLKKVIEAVENNDVKSLHRLRIACKKFIYLEEAGILSFSQPDIKDLLVSINRNLGIMNDAVANERLVVNMERNGTPGTSGKELDFAKKIISDKFLAAGKESRLDILELRLRI